MSHLPAPSQPAPAAVTKPAVTPLCVFAAGRHSFEVIVRRQDWLHGAPRESAKAKIFANLPLQAHGWDIQTARISLVARTSGDEAIWRLTRGSEAGHHIDQERLR